MNRYDAIFRRRSVRSYSKDTLGDDVLRKIQKSLDSRVPLFPELNTEVKMLNWADMEGAIKGILPGVNKIQAPHYLVVCSREEKGCMENVGYSMERVVLDLTRWGVGTCWMGAGFRMNEVERVADVGEDMRVVILVAFGEAEGESPWRDPGDFKRRPLSELMLNGKPPKGEWLDILEAARMAPSAINLQPWRFHLGHGGVHLYISNKGGVLEMALKRFTIVGELNRIDAGIALSHVDIGAERFGKEIRFEYAEAREFPGHRYVISVLEK